MFWEALGEPCTFENHAKVYNHMQFQGLDPFGAESVSGSAFSKGLACSLSNLGADWDTHRGYIWQLLQAFSGSDFGGSFEKAKSNAKFEKLGGRGGAGRRRGTGRSGGVRGRCGGGAVRRARGRRRQRGQRQEQAPAVRAVHPVGLPWSV